MKYEKFKYIFPQIPNKKLRPQGLAQYDNGEHLLTPAYQGLPCVIFTNGFELMVYDQNGKILRDVSQSIDFRKLSKSKNWFVYSGLYCSKFKNVELKYEHDRFVITDVLVWDGEYLVGSTLLERLSLLDHAFEFNATLIIDTFAETFKYIYCTEITGVFKAKYYTENFSNLFHQIKEAHYTGVILHKKENELADSFKRRNNRNDQILCTSKFNFFNF